MSAKVQFGVGNIIDPTEAMQKTMAGVSNTIGEISKNYMLEDRYKAQLEEEKRRTDLQQAAADKQLLARQQEFDQEMALRRAADERAAMKFNREIEQENNRIKFFQNFDPDRVVADIARDKFINPKIELLENRSKNDYDKNAVYFDDEDRKNILSQQNQAIVDSFQTGPRVKEAKEAENLVSQRDLEKRAIDAALANGVLPENLDLVTNRVKGYGTDWEALQQKEDQNRKNLVDNYIELYKASVRRINSSLNNEKIGNIISALENGTENLEGVSGWFDVLNGFGAGTSEKEDGAAAIKAIYNSKEFKELPAKDKLALAALTIELNRSGSERDQFDLSPEEAVVYATNLRNSGAIKNGTITDIGDNGIPISNVLGLISTPTRNLQQEAIAAWMSETPETWKNSTPRSVLIPSASPAPATKSDTPSLSNQIPNNQYTEEQLYDMGMMPGLNGPEYVGKRAFGNNNTMNAIGRDVLNTGKFTPEQLAIVGNRLKDLGVDEDKIKFAQEQAAKTGDITKLMLMEAEANRPGFFDRWQMGAKKSDYDTQFYNEMVIAKLKGATEEQAKEYATEKMAEKRKELNQMNNDIRRYEQLNNIAQLPKENRVIALKKLLGLLPEDTPVFSISNKEKSSVNTSRNVLPMPEEKLDPYYHTMNWWKK